MTYFVNKGRGLLGFIQRNIHGILIAVVAAIAAQSLSEHYGAPAMLMALLLGMPFHFLSKNSKCSDGINYTSRTVLRLGVALLGARVSVELIANLDPYAILLVISGVVLTIFFGLLCAKIAGYDWRFGMLTGGSVAICGASAAMAIAAILPKSPESERHLIFTVISVTVLSTVAMIMYPILTSLLALDHYDAGIFLGGTIHDVAQVVGAGFSVSDQTGTTATLVKLIRVMMLAPVAIVLSVLVRRYAADAANPESKPSLIPSFVLGFLALVVLHSTGALPEYVTDTMASLSRWALLSAIAAVGMKTSIKQIIEVGGKAISIVVAETLFIAIFVLVGMHLLQQ